MRAWGLSIALVLCLGCVRADEATQKMLDCMRANIPPTVRIQEVEITATDRTGADRMLKGKLYALKDKGLVRAMLKISAPSDLSGAAYLLRETQPDRGDETYFYLPAVDRVRRITGASANASLLGTDFSYEEMKQLQSAFSGSDAKLEKTETLDQHPVQVLSLAPAAGSAARYNTVRAWVDQKSCVALKIEFFEGDSVRKELSAPAASLQQSGNYWYLSEVLMRDLRDGTKTRLKIVGVSSGADIPNRLFDPHTFYIGN